MGFWELLCMGPCWIVSHCCTACTNLSLDYMINIWVRVKKIVSRFISSYHWLAHRLFLSPDINTYTCIWKLYTTHYNTCIGAIFTMKTMNVQFYCTFCSCYFLVYCRFRKKSNKSFFLFSGFIFFWTQISFPNKNYGWCNNVMLNYSFFYLIIQIKE